MSTSLRSLGETERLRLRQPLDEDLDKIADLWADEIVTEHIGGPRDRSMVLEFFREYASNPEPYAQDEGERWWSIIETSSEQLVGLSSLIEKEIEGRVETDLGYFLLPAYWGKGCATEAARRVAEYAFSELHLESLVAVIHPENAASISVARRLGMRLEAEVLRPGGVMRHVYRLVRPT